MPGIDERASDDSRTIQAGEHRPDMGQAPRRPLHSRRIARAGSTRPSADDQYFEHINPNDLPTDERTGPPATTRQHRSAFPMGRVFGGIGAKPSEPGSG
ncbi:hypothetical protein B1S06_02340 [Rhodopseudomonas palustris]|nr:hypothetical protein B1S06_02340 [Rhodopseudomonas palustris]